MIDAIDGLLAPLLVTLERMMWVQRHLHPPLAGQLADQLAPPAERDRRATAARWKTPPGRTSLVFMRERLVDVGRRRSTW